MSTDRVGGSGIVRRHKATHATGGTDALTPADIGAVANSLFTAKASLVSATAANTPATLTVGTNGYVLTADSAEATGLKWAAVGGGKDDADNILAVQVFG